MIDEDPYIERLDPFLEAALPSGEVGVEHTFDMFLEDYVRVYEKRLQGKISTEGLNTLLQASLQETNGSNRDRQEFNELMEFLFEQIPPEDNVTAAQIISEAYRSLHDSRRNRYNQVLDRLSKKDREALQTEYFNKLMIDIAPTPQSPRHYRFSLAIEFPNEDPQRITRVWTYLLARGLPVKMAKKSYVHGCSVSSVSGGPSNGY